MASPVGGRFVVELASVDTTTGAFSFSTAPTVSLDLNSGSGAVAVGGDWNIEVFTTGSTLPSPGAGFSDSALAPGGSLVNNYLASQALTLGSGNYIITDTPISGSGQTGTQVNLGSGNQQVTGLSGDTLMGGTGLFQVLDASAGSETVAGGSGADSIWAGAGDSVTGGTGSEQIVVSGAGTTVVAGASGSETISLVSGDTVTANAGSAAIGVNASAGNDSVDLSSNDNTVTVTGSNTYITGGAGDTITAGSGNTGIDAQAGGMSVQLTAGATDIVGANAGDTITGGSGFTGSLNFNPNATAATAGGDMIDLSGGGGMATINAYSTAAGDVTAVNDTIEASNGADSVWGGNGDSIGAASTGGAGQGLFDHSTSVTGAAVNFGTWDSVSAVTYNTVAGTASTDTTVAGYSSAKDTVTNFNTTNDSVFYASRSANNQDSSIVATAKSVTVGTTASSLITLPDGTQMTLVGITNPGSITFTS